MYEYKFVEVKLDNMIFGREMFDHRDYIIEQAQHGWRFVAYIPTKVNSSGIPTLGELVFERALK